MIVSISKYWLNNYSRIIEFEKYTYDCWTNPRVVSGWRNVLDFDVQDSPQGHIQDIRVGRLKETMLNWSLVSRRENWHGVSKRYTFIN